MVSKETAKSRKRKDKSERITTPEDLLLYLEKRARLEQQRATKERRELIQIGKRGWLAKVLRRAHPAEASS